MNALLIPPNIWYLELALMLLALIAFVWACLLIQSTRRSITIAPKPPVHLPSTPLTREGRKRARVLTIV